MSIQVASCLFSFRGYRIIVGLCVVFSRANMFLVCCFQDRVLEGAYCFTVYINEVKLGSSDSLCLLGDEY